MAIVDLTVKKLLQGKTLSEADGLVRVTADHYVLAIGDISKLDSQKIEEYLVAQIGIEGFSRSINSEESETKEIRSGKNSVKTSTQVEMGVEGSRVLNDGFQEKILAFEMLYGTGQEVIVPYVYFNLVDGKGEIGLVTNLVDNDGSGSAGENAAISIKFKQVGGKPKKFSYNTDKEKTFDTIGVEML